MPVEVGCTFVRGCGNCHHVAKEITIRPGESEQITYMGEKRVKVKCQRPFGTDEALIEVLDPLNIEGFIFKDENDNEGSEVDLSCRTIIQGSEELQLTWENKQISIRLTDLKNEQTLPREFVTV